MQIFTPFYHPVPGVPVTFLAWESPSVFVY